MDDKFLSKYRKTPRPEFSQALYERIDRPMENHESSTRVSLMRWTPRLAAVAALLIASLVFFYPPAQATAQGFLDLFRVQKFSALAVDPARLQQIKDTNINFESMLATDVQKVKTPTAPVVVADAAAASNAAGFTVRVPQTLPAGFSLSEVRVMGEGTVRITADTAKLQALLDALQINDVKPPAALKGAVITVHRPASVMLSYATRSDPVTVIQGTSPEITLPDGVSLADLGMIGLRILGMNAAEAQAFASQIDWRTTMLVPVPTNAASFRYVDVHGSQGVLITTGGTGGSSIRPANGARQQSLLLFSQGNMLYGISGGPVSTDLVELANALQ